MHKKTSYKTPLKIHFRILRRLMSNERQHRKHYIEMPTTCMIDCPIGKFISRKMDTYTEFNQFEKLTFGRWGSWCWSPVWDWLRWYPRHWSSTQSLSYRNYQAHCKGEFKIWCMCMYVREGEREQTEKKMSEREIGGLHTPWVYAFLSLSSWFFELYWEAPCFRPRSPTPNQANRRNQIQWDLPIPFVLSFK